MANFAGVAAARSARAPVNVVRDGLGAVGRPMCVYVSEEAHFSIAKAAAMLGLGEANVRHVKTNDRFQLDLADLESHVDATAPPDSSFIRRQRRRRHRRRRPCFDCRFARATALAPRRRCAAAPPTGPRALFADTSRPIPSRSTRTGNNLPMGCGVPST
jgi:hypothetical protein